MLMSLYLLVAPAAKICPAVAKYTDAGHAPYPGKLDLELGDHMPTITSLKQLLWDAYFSTDKRPVHSFTDFSNLKCSPGERQ